MRISRTRRTQPSRLGTLRVGAIFGAWAATAIGSHALAQDASRLKPLPLTIKQVPVSVGHPHANPGAPAPRGSCPENVITHTDANFTGGQFVAQAGFSETEIAAVSYSIPQAAFPIKLDLAEMIFATSQATQQTVTQWSFLVWSGNPQTGTLEYEFNSDDVILPHIRVGPGTAGVNVQVSVDPGDPDQIIIDAPADGSHVFSIGYRIDHHNAQTSNPCFTSPPSCCNAFPTTDVSGLQHSTDNWLFGVNCGSFGCPANGGWARFSNLPSFCRPSGDWVIRATWESVNCQSPIGACCQTDGSCSLRTQAECVGVGGVYQGDNVLCGSVNCPQPATGACCFTNGTCDIRSSASCASAGGTYRGNNTTCATANCPQPTQACCFPSTGGCLNLSPANCAAAGGISGGAGTACATYVCFPTGACCLPSGQCIGPVSPTSCQAQNGVFQGNGTTCAQTNCPLPTGACCFSTGFCLTLIQSDCQTAGGTYRGNGTTCADNNNNGRADACEPQCPCDFNHSGTLNSQDFFDFISCFFTPSCSSADFNSNGQVNSQDFFDFLSCFFTPPAGC